MHRSGTSLMASFFQLCGISMGDDLVGAGKGNIFGHFEDREILGLHRDILESNATSEMVPKNDLSLFECHRQQLTDILARRKAKGGDWGWKEPRTTLFLHYWAKELPEAHFVLLYRDPYEVINSMYRRLKRRYFLTPFMPFKSWLRYNESLLRFIQSEDGRYCLINIGAFNRDWEAGARVLSENLGREFSSSYDQVYHPKHMRSSKTKVNWLASLYYRIGKRIYQDRLDGLYAELDRFAAIPSRVAD
nr:sulfotransferase [Desulfomicrobium sp. ZS1]